MSEFIKVDGHNNLVREVNSNAIINNDKSEFQLYMQRRKSRERQSDELRNAVKEINNLKKDIREIKNLIKQVIK
tara:strand:- start:411 stop:632 length:222 start_codon:yes stop_codon:yes gene_type:complete